MHSPCRLCLHVVAVVRLVCFNDPLSLMPDRSKVIFQTKRNTEVFTPCGDCWGSLPGRVLSSDEPVQVNQRRRHNTGRGPHLF